MRAHLRESFGLAEIFFGPFANLFRRRRASRVPGRRVLFESLEPRILLSADLLGAESPFEFFDESPAALVFDAPADADANSYTLRLNADSGDLELLNGTSVVLSQKLAETSGVVVNGQNGLDDSLTIDFAFGGVFSLADGITFNGGAGGNDILIVTGGAFSSATHLFTDTGPGRSGTMIYEGGSSAPAVIHYTDLEPIDMSGSSIDALVFNLPGTNDQAILEDDGTLGNGISRIRSQNGAPTFESTAFSNTVVSLTINMGGDNGAFTVASLPDYSGALTINGQGGMDSVSVTGAASFSTLSVLVGGTVNANGASNLQVAGNAHFSGSNITLGAGPAIANFGTLNFNAAGTVTLFEDSETVLAGTSTATTFNLTSSGSITEALGASIRGSNAGLFAGTHIGASGASPLDVDLANLVASSGTAGSGGIFINDLDLAANGLRIQLIDADAGTGAIEITTAVGDIADGNGTSINLFGSSVVLSAGRHIGFNGTAIDALEINTGALTATSGTAGAAGDIYLSQQGNQPLRLNTISADGGAGTIDILSGAPVADLLDGNGAAVNLQGGTVSLTSGRHIGFDGTSIDALETEVTTLAARGALGVPVTAGDIHINELGGSIALGLLDAEAGNISIAAAGSITDANGNAVNLRASAVTLSAGQHIGSDGGTPDALDADAVTIAQLDAGGTVALAAYVSLMVAGDFDAGKNDVILTSPSVVLAPEAVLHVDLGGTAPGEFTRYNILGPVSLGGTLDADLVDGFEPVIGDRLHIMDFGSSTGAFAATDLPVDFLLEPHATDVELVYIPDPDIFIDDVEVFEGDSGETAAVFTVVLSGPSTQIVTVDFATVDGTATAGFDYQPAGGTLTFNPGEMSKEVLVTVNGDTMDEFDETFTVTLFNAVEGVIEDGLGTGVILDDDPLPTIAIGDVSVIEGDAGIVNAVFAVTLSQASGKPISVDFATSDDTALAGFDYQALVGTVAFAPGDTVKEISVAVNGDFLDEFDETFTVSLSNAVNSSISDGLGQGTIVDDDATVSITDAVVIEGDAGTTMAVFDVSLADASIREVSVDFATTDGTALAGSDYETHAGTLTFAPGETNKQAAVAVNGDLLDEFDEMFSVTLSNSLNATIADGMGLGTIFDDDTAPVFVEIGPQTVQEGGELHFTLVATDADVPAQTLTFSAGTLPDGASFDPATQEFVWLPLDDASATVTFTVTDSDGLTDVMTVALTATNAAPTVDAGEDQVVGLQRTDDDKHDHRHKHGHGRPDADVSIAAAFDDLGAEDTHVATIDWGDGTVTDGTVSEPAGDADGSVTGEHTYKKAGTYTVKVTVTDDDGGTRSDTLLVAVEKPVEKKNFDSREDHYKLKEDTVLQVGAPKGVLANDRTPAGATIEARLVEGPRHGELVLNVDGSFTYVPESDYHGKDSFWYEFTDGNNVSQAVEVELKVKDDRPASRCRIDWDGHWHAGWGHDFQPFGHHAWKRFF